MLTAFLCLHPYRMNYRTPLAIHSCCMWSDEKDGRKRTLMNSLWWAWEICLSLFTAKWTVERSGLTSTALEEGIGTLNTSKCVTDAEEVTTVQLFMTFCNLWMYCQVVSSFSHTDCIYDHNNRCIFSQLLHYFCDFKCFG